MKFFIQKQRIGSKLATEAPEKKLVSMDTNNAFAPVELSLQP